MSKPTLICSFSGGRTSAFMSRWLQLNKSSEYDIRYVFANTGQEHENTLRFIDKCDKAWGLGVIWLEAEVSEEHGKGTRHKYVSFETASRDGKPFEDVIRKYGIPNQAYPHCTRELKLNPINSWRNENGLQNAITAVGIRADEIDRMAEDYRERGLVYPLISWKRMTKSGVIDWWKSQPFDLDVPERLGNCVWCWKKSFRKHLTNIAENPCIYDFPLRMEELYPLAGCNKGDTPRVFFRGHRSTKQLIELASKPFSPFIESSQHQIDWVDEANGCSESCDAYMGAV